MYNFKNKNLFSNDILNPNKNQRYYYDLGTGNKIEREEVKEERNAFLGAVNKTSTKPQNQKKDDFLEGFNDPYGENRDKNGFVKNRSEKKSLPISAQTPILELALRKMRPTRFSKGLILKQKKRTFGKEHLIRQKQV